METECDVNRVLNFQLIIFQLIIFSDGDVFTATEEKLQIKPAEINTRPNILAEKSKIHNDFTLWIGNLRLYGSLHICGRS